jgi:hypothetical protein
MSYRHVRQTGVTALERRDVNMRHRGVRSRYHAVVIEMVAIASRIASVRQREIWEPLRVLAKNALMALDLEPERFSTLLLSGRPLLTQAIQSDFIGTDEDSLRIRVLSMLIEARRVPSSCLSEDSSEPAGPGGRAASLVAAKVGR